MSILHINSSARLADSNTRIVGQYLVDTLVQSEGQAQVVVSRDLAQQPLPPISAEDLIGVHGSHDSSRESLQAQLTLSNQLIDELKDANTLVIGAPIYNFTVPVTLKQWVDTICRAGISFKYSAQGPEGLLNIQRAYLVMGSGGVPIGSPMDFASGYLKCICQFIGVKEVFVIDVSGSKGSPEEVIAQGKQQVDELIKTV